MAVLNPARKKRASKTPSASIDTYVEVLLERIVDGKRILNFPKGENIFAQGEYSDAIFFVQSGRVKISVVSTGGKEAVLAMLGPHGFFGEGALVGQSVRISSASTLEATTVFRVEKTVMIRALRDQTELSEKFLAALLMRNIEIEEDLCDQLFNHSEKRLARVLMKLARLRDHDEMPNARLTALSHETLAEMVGTTRSRITHFMNKFRKLGLIDYGSNGLTVKMELLTDLVLHE